MPELVRAPIDVAALLGGSARPDCGALAVFLETTREHHEGKKVVRLEYEAYETMAHAALAELEREVTGRYSVASCRIVHRLGDVPLTEVSVVVVVAAAHRGPAFDACRWAMDELKAKIPIWKKERYEGGGEAWVEGTRLG